MRTYLKFKKECIKCGDWFRPKGSKCMLCPICFNRKKRQTTIKIRSMGAVPGRVTRQSNAEKLDFLRKMIKRRGFEHGIR